MKYCDICKNEIRTKDFCSTEHLMTNNGETAIEHTYCSKTCEILGAGYLSHANFFMNDLNKITNHLIEMHGCMPEDIEKALNSEIGKEIRKKIQQ